MFIADKHSSLALYIEYFTKISFIVSSTEIKHRYRSFSQVTSIVSNSELMSNLAKHMQFETIGGITVGQIGS